MHAKLCIFKSLNPISVSPSLIGFIALQTICYLSVLLKDPIMVYLCQDLDRIFRDQTLNLLPITCCDDSLFGAELETFGIVYTSFSLRIEITCMLLLFVVVKIHEGQSMLMLFISVYTLLLLLLSSSSQYTLMVCRFR